MAELILEDKTFFLTIEFSQNVHSMSHLINTMACFKLITTENTTKVNDFNTKKLQILKKEMLHSIM